MTVSSVEIRKLQADTDMVLTNGEAYSSVGGAVYLSNTATVDKWFEITKKQYEQIEASREVL
ncbi:MAG: hypothetical protein IKJ55_03635 [Clostridia bacterium]|nr:hypothetical protein [Clostridia bacterium]